MIHSGAIQPKQKARGTPSAGFSVGFAVGRRKRYDWPFPLKNTAPNAMANLPANTSAKLDQRLKEVHQTDLTEGRINQDFVDWLKTKGMTYLLVLLIALCAYLGWVRWQHSRQNYQAEAWRELASAALPTSLEEVAQKYGDVGAVGMLARLNAAAELMRAVQTGKTLGADEASRLELTSQQRDEYLDRADRLYREMIESDDKSAGKTLMMVTALTGRAAVADSKGDTAKAKEFYAAAATRAGDTYPELAAASRKRGEVAGTLPPPASMPTDEQIKSLQPKAPEPATPVTVETWITELIGGKAAPDAPAADFGG